MQRHNKAELQRFTDTKGKGNQEHSFIVCFPTLFAACGNVGVETSVLTPPLCSYFCRLFFFFTACSRCCLCMCRQKH